MSRGAPPVGPAGDIRKGVGRQSGLTSIAAMVAVVSGLGLDAVIIAKFGATGDTDAFVVGARIPLALLAMLMATGNQALVPTFSTWMVKQSRVRTSQLVSTVLCSVLVAGAIGGLALAAVAGPLTALISPGFDDRSQDLAAELARMMVLVVPLTAGSEVLRAYLNARYSFVAPAAMTTLLNGVAVAVVLTGGDDIRVVPKAYVIGGAVQFAVMLLFAVSRGLRLRPTRDAFRSAEITGAGRLAVRPFIASALNPFARAVELALASFLPAGSATIAHYASRLIHAVGGTVLFRSVLVAVLPRLSRARADDNDEDFRRLTLHGTQIMLALSIPLTTLMLALTVPGIRLVFERGRFDASDAALLGATLAVYALSLVGSGVQRALLAPFYANLDTKMPLRNTIYGVGANIVLLPAFVLPLRGEERGVLALAAAYGVSQYVHVAHAAYRLRRDLGITLRPLRRAALRSTVAGVLGGGVAAGVAAVTGIYDDVATPHLLAGLMAAGTAGLAVVLLAERRGGGALSQLRKLRRSAPSGANDATDRKQAEPSLAERSS